MQNCIWNTDKWKPKFHNNAWTPEEYRFTTSKNICNLLTYQFSNAHNRRKFLDPVEMKSLDCHLKILSIITRCCQMRAANRGWQKGQNGRMNEYESNSCFLFHWRHRCHHFKHRSTEWCTQEFLMAFEPTTFSLVGKVVGSNVALYTKKWGIAWNFYCFKWHLFPNL